MCVCKILLGGFALMVIIEWGGFLVALVGTTLVGFWQRARLARLLGPAKAQVTWPSRVRTLSRG